MSNDIYPAILQLMPDEAIRQLQNAINTEFMRRHSGQGPDGVAGPSYESLVEKFGADGSKKLNLDNSGYLEKTKPTPRFELGQIPFPVDFDEDLNVFVYTPRGYILDELVRVLGYNVAVSPEVRELADGNLEILIEPMLYLGERVSIRNLPKGKTVKMVETLDEFVAWHKRTEAIDTTPVPYIGQSFDPELALVEYKGHTLSTEHKSTRGVFTATPFLVGKSIDVISNSNVPALINRGHVKPTVMLERCPMVKSVFVQVGMHLIRVMTNRTPYSRFCPSPVEGRVSSLDLRAAVNITKGMRDCFGNVMPWTELLNDEGLDLEISLHGSFDVETGMIKTGMGGVSFVSYDTSGELLAGLLSDSSKCMAFELDGALV